MAQVTIYRNTTSTKDPHYVSVETIVGRIRDGNSREMIEKIRAADDNERKKLKKQLPAISFSGIFSKRADSAILKHTGYIALDLDKILSVHDVKKEMSRDKHTMVCFISPSGNGLKVIFKIPANTGEHERRCKAITKYITAHKVDELTDVSRLCYESYDPDIYYNPDSDLFMDIIPEEKKVVPKIIDGKRMTDPAKVVDILEKWQEKKREYYADGNKHKYLVAMASGCNRGGVSESRCAGELQYRFSGRASFVAPEDFDKITSSIYNTYTHQHGITYFTENEERSVATGKVRQPEEDFSSKDFVKVENIEDDMWHTFDTGLDKGETTYFKEFDEHYRLKRGELTLFHGITNHGKSTFVMQMCLLKSIRDGYRWVFFSPEQHPPEDFFNDLVHMYIGKTTTPSKFQMSREEYTEGMAFINEHFVLITAHDDSPTPDFIMTRFAMAIDEYKVDGCIIDPYNQMVNDIIKNSGGREDQYLSSFLSKYKRFAQTRNIFMLVITHPKGDIKKDKDGNYEIPDIYNLSGGAMWSNKCDNVVCVYRPYWNTDRDNPMVWVESQKIKKQRLCGRPGKTIMEFDWKTLRYNEASEISPLNPIKIAKKADKDFDWHDKDDPPF